VHALEDISHDPNPESSCKAALYLNSVTKIDFLVALDVTVTCFSCTLQFSISLQSKQLDISKALSDLMVIRSALEELREGADGHFKQIFKDVSDIANLANVEICIPRICSRRRQTQRININSKDPETYFKVSVFFPFLDFILQELDARFNQRLSDIIPLQGLIHQILVYTTMKLFGKRLLPMLKIFQLMIILFLKQSCAFGDTNGKISKLKQIRLLIHYPIAQMSYQM